MKLQIFLLFLILTLSITTAKIGDKSEFEIQKIKEDINYIEVVDRIISKYNQNYHYVNITKEVCDYRLNINNINESFCENKTSSILLPDGTQTPVYSYENAKAIKYGTYTYDFDTKGCFVCKSVTAMPENKKYNGNLILCFSKKDGFNYNRGEEFKCVKRSGESAKIINLNNNKLIAKWSDVGEI